MFISICYITLPVFVLVHNVNSVDLYKSKRVPRDLEEIKTPYNANHPPLQEQHIPVRVIYDDEEDIRILTKSTKETTQSLSESRITLPSSIRNSEKPVVLTLKAQFGNGPPAVEAYDTIPVAIVTDNVEENNSDRQNEEKTVSKIADQEKIIKSDIPTDVEQAKKTKLRERPVKIEATTSKSDININATVSNVRKPSQRRRLHRVLKTNVTKHETSRNEKPNKAPEIVAKDKTNEKTKNNSQPTRSSQFQKRTQQPVPVVPIIDSENYVYAFNGDYHYSYEGGDGTKAYERGEQLKTEEGSSSGNGVVGGFSYTDNDGNDFSLSYTADENGYRPIGAHLPTPPPIPPAIQRALDLLATKTTPEPVTERVNKFN